MSMRKPPAATAAVKAHDPMVAWLTAQAAPVVMRWPPGLMVMGRRKGRAAAERRGKHSIVGDGAQFVAARGKTIAYEVRPGRHGRGGHHATTGRSDPACYSRSLGRFELEP